MKSRSISIEPLADYLKEQFGNANNRGDEFGLLPWTEELREAIKLYLLEKVPQELHEWLDKQFSDFTGPTEEQVDKIISTHEPWQITYELHMASVRALPTLGDLIDDAEVWSVEDDPWDAGAWLATHASTAQLHAMVQHSGFNLGQHAVEQSDAQESLPSVDIALELAELLSPTQLLTAWNNANHMPLSEGSSHYRGVATNKVS